MKKNQKVGTDPVSARKKNKGITLVALIITIIVMLILVAVSIQIVINSNLIGMAQNTADRTEEAYESESTMNNIKVGDKTLDEYIESKAKTISFKMYYYIDGREGDINTYTAKEGETWMEWIGRNMNSESDESIWKALADIYNYRDSSKVWFSISEYSVEAGVKDSDDGFVLWTSSIIEGETYCVYGAGLGY